MDACFLCVFRIFRSMANWYNELCFAPTAPGRGARPAGTCGLAADLDVGSLFGPTRRHKAAALLPPLPLLSSCPPPPSSSPSGGKAGNRSHTGRLAPDTMHRAPGTGHRAPGAGHRAPGTVHEAPGTKREALGTEIDLKWLDWLEEIYDTASADRGGVGDGVHLQLALLHRTDRRPSRKR